MQGVQPGPNLFSVHGGLVFTFIFSFILANVVMLFMAMYGSRYVGKIINLPSFYLVPFIIFLAVIGSYSIRNNFADIIMLVGIGLFAYIAIKLGFQAAPVVLGLILGPIAEKGFTQTILLGQAKGHVLAEFFTKPISIILIILSVLSLCGPLFSKWLKPKIESSDAPEVKRGG